MTHIWFCSAHIHSGLTIETFHALSCNCTEKITTRRRCITSHRRLYSVDLRAFLQKQRQPFSHKHSCRSEKKQSQLVDSLDMKQSFGGMRGARGNATASGEGPVFWLFFNARGETTRPRQRSMKLFVWKHSPNTPDKKKICFLIWRVECVAFKQVTLFVLKMLGLLCGLEAN